MKIQPSTALRGLDGQAIVNGGVELTLGHVCEQALQLSKAANGQEGYKQFVLAERIHNAPKGLDLPAEDVVIVKRCVGEHWFPLISGPAWRELEGDKPGE